MLSLFWAPLSSLSFMLSEDQRLRNSGEKVESTERGAEYPATRSVRTLGYGHTALRTPYPVRSAKISNAGPG